MRFKAIAKHVVEKMAAPSGCVITAESSAQSEPRRYFDGHKIRRNFLIDVSARIPKHIVDREDAADCSDDEIFYLDLRDTLRNEIANEVLRILDFEKPDDLLPCGLTSEREEDVCVYCFGQGTLTVRSRLFRQKAGETIWKINLLIIFPVGVCS